MEYNHTIDDKLCTKCFYNSTINNFTNKCKKCNNSNLIYACYDCQEYFYDKNDLCNKYIKKSNIIKNWYKNINNYKYNQV